MLSCHAARTTLGSSLLCAEHFARCLSTSCRTCGAQNRRSTLARDGAFKIVNECPLPYTGRGMVKRIITDLAVIDIVPASESGGLVLVELAPDVTIEELQETEPPIRVP